MCLLVGIVWGIIPLTGTLGLASFGLVSGGSMVFYLGSFLRVDIEELGGAFDVAKEGFMSGLGLFIVRIAVAFFISPLTFRYVCSWRGRRCTRYCMPSRQCLRVHY